MTIRFARSTIGALLLGAACGSGPTEASLPPLTPLEAAIKRDYKTSFNEEIPRPAIFSSASCSAGHVTTTAYLRQAGKISDLMTLYTSNNGDTVTKQLRYNALTPAGTFRVLVVLLRYSQTIGNDAEVPWEQAQSQVNDNHAAFAKARGYAAPIVVFDNTNVILDASQVADPRTKSGVTTALSQNGTSVVGYDFIVAVNIDPSRSEGGFAITNVLPAFIYMGNFSRWNAPLTAFDFTSLARAIYHHEVVHHWGWPGTHDWASCGNNSFGFIVPPVLLGWEDVDGDGMPEILDPTPYGRPGL